MHVPRPPTQATAMCGVTETQMPSRRQGTVWCTGVRRRIISAGTACSVLRVARCAPCFVSAAWTDVPRVEFSPSLRDILRVSLQVRAVVQRTVCRAVVQGNCTEQLCGLVRALARRTLCSAYSRLRNVAISAGHTAELPFSHPAFTRSALRSTQCTVRCALRFTLYALRCVPRFCSPRPRLLRTQFYTLSIQRPARHIYIHPPTRRTSFPFVRNPLIHTTQTFILTPPQ